MKNLTTLLQTLPVQARLLVVLLALPLPALIVEPSIREILALPWAAVFGIGGVAAVLQAGRKPPGPPPLPPGSSPSLPPGPS